MKEFASNRNLLPKLRGVHNTISSRINGRISADGLLVQPSLAFDYKRELDGAEHDKNRIATQKRYLASFYELVKQEEPTVHALLQLVTADYLSQNPAVGTGPVELHRGPLKQMDRILEKADLKKHHFEELRDYGRSCWIVDSVSRLPALLQRLEDGYEFDIVRCKNRFDPAYKAAKSGGYRDYQLVLRTRQGAESLLAAPLSTNLKPISCAWLYEVQIMTKGFHDLKEGVKEVGVRPMRSNSPHTAATPSSGAGSGAAGDRVAHEAYKNFRKFQELSERIILQGEEMKQELDFSMVDNNIAKVALVRRSISQSVFVKKARRMSQQRVGKVSPTGVQRPSVVLSN